MQLIRPDAELVKQWLTNMGHDHYICGQCHGIHLGDFEDQDSAIETRVFIEENGILLTTEMAIRPSQLLTLTAELGPLNVEYPQLKIFTDIVDQDIPRLVVCDLMLTGQGITEDQFRFFVEVTMPTVKEVLDYCQPYAMLDEFASMDPQVNSFTH